jgi:hypothetical protein
MREQRWGFIDGAGKEVIPAMYEQVGYFSEDLAPVVLNKKIGFINKQAKIVIEPQFDGMVKPFTNGLAVMSKDGVQIRIDKNGKGVK